MDTGSAMEKSSLLEDFVRFKDEKSLESRMRLTRGICQQFNDGAFRPQEKKIVKDILDYLSKDIEASVRRVLSETLKDNPDLPHKIAIRLAADVEDVAVPILRFSSVLSDDDLEEIIKSSIQAAKKLSAIAMRDNLSSRISTRIVETGSHDAVSALLENDSANINDNTLERVSEIFRNSENMLAALVKHGKMSSALAEKMVFLVSGKLQAEIKKRYNVDPEIIKKSIKETRDKIILGNVVENSDSENSAELVEHLYNSGKLTHSLVLRALCRADIEFFEAGMAKLAGIPQHNAAKLIHQGDSRGFEALFQAATMPPTMLQATEVLLGLILKNRRKADEGIALYSRRMIHEIMNRHYDREIPNMQYFLALIASSAADSPPPGLH